MFNGYTISANDEGYYISAAFTSNTSWNNVEYSGTPRPNYYVYKSGSLNDFVLAGSAYAEVYSGGIARNLQLQSGKNIYMSCAVLSVPDVSGCKASAGGASLTVSGVDLSGFTMYAGASLTIAGGTLQNLTIPNGGFLYDGCTGMLASHVKVTDLAGTTVLVKGGTMCDGRYTANGASATLSGLHRLNAGYLEVTNGAVATNLRISAWGGLTVSAGGKAAGTVVSGGNLTVLKKGQAEKTHVSAGTLLVNKEGTITGTRVSGGIATVKGKAIDTVVSANAQELVVGGVASSTTVSTGGSQMVSGGKAFGTKVKGGLLQVYSGGVASNANINGGTMVVGMDGAYSGTATAVGTVIAKGSMSVLTKKSRTSLTTISAGAVQRLDGAIDTSATIAGTQHLYWNASALNAIVKKGGRQILHSTSLARGTTIEGGGKLLSELSATTSGLLVRGTATIDSRSHDYKAKIHGSQLVKNNAVATGATIYDGGKQIIGSQGNASGTIVSKGGCQLVSGLAFASGTVVGNGGMQVVSQGVASGTIISKGGKVDARAGGFVAGVQVKGGGLLTVRQSGSLTWGKATVSSGGRVVLSAGASFDELDARKGAIISGGTVKKKIAASSELALNGNVNAKDLHVATTKIGMLKIHVAGVNNVLGSLKDDVGADYLQVSDVYRTRLSYDLRSAQTGMNMLTLSNASKLRCYCTIQTAKNQKTGTYKLSNGLNLTFGKMATDPNGITIKVGTTNISARTGETVKKNGMQYALSLAGNQFDLSIGLVYGAMRKGTAKADKLTGTTNSDIFYGGKGNDTIYGKNGRDVAVYDKTAWGKDVIAKTSGTMTLLFKDLKAADIVKKTSGKNMIITKKSDTKQKITVKNWSDTTHNIVFGSNMSKFNTYLNATSPTKSQTTAARNEVWKKAGLASA